MKVTDMIRGNFLSWNIYITRTLQFCHENLVRNLNSTNKIGQFCNTVFMVFNNCPRTLLPFVEIMAF